MTVLSDTWLVLKTGGIVLRDGLTCGLKKTHLDNL